MAKAKYTDNGNIKVTMSTDEFTAILAVLQHVRLGSAGVYTNAASQFLIDMESTEPFCDYEDLIMDASDCVAIQIQELDSWHIEFRG